jgi:S1-C subfamily serine protease
MKRQVALAAGAAVAVAAALAVAPAVRARSTSDEDKDQRIEKRVVVRTGGGRLGVSIDEAAGDARGALVRRVDEGSAADKAGVKEGDVIVRFDGESVRSAAQLARLVGETPSGRAVAIEVTRGGATQKLTATLAEGGRGFRFHGGDGGDFHFEMPEIAIEPPEPPEAPEAPLAPRAPHPPKAPHPPMAWSWNDDDGGLMIHKLLGGPRKLGIEYMEIGEQLAGYFKVSGKSGVLVTSVDSDGPAAKAGMKAGDVVTKLGAEAIADSDDLRHAVSKAEAGSQVAVTVQREGRPVELKVTLAKSEPLIRKREARGVSL